MSRMVRSKKLSTLEAEAGISVPTASALSIMNELRSYAELGVPVEVWVTTTEYHRITDKGSMLLVAPLLLGSMANEAAELTVVAQGVACRGAVGVPNSDRVLWLPLTRATFVDPGQTVAFGPGQISFTYVE